MTPPTCRRTDAVAGRLLAGETLTDADRAHLAVCGACTDVRDRVARFGPALDEAAAEVVHAAAVQPGPARQRRTGIGPVPLLAWSGAIAGALVLAVALGAGLPRLLGGIGPSLGGGLSSEALDAWLEVAPEEVWRSLGRSGSPERYEPFHVETCGSHAIAFFADPSRGPAGIYLWAVGTPGAQLGPTTGSLAAWLSDEEAAAIRATLPPCRVVLEPKPANAWPDGRGAWPFDRLVVVGEGGRLDRIPVHEVQVVDVRPMAVRSFVQLLEVETQRGTYLERSVVVVDEDHTVSVVSRTGLLAGALEPMQVYLDADVPTRPIVYAAIDDERVAAVDLVTGRTTLRYTVSAPGMIIQLGRPLGDKTTFRFLDAAGAELWSGSVSSADARAGN